MQTHTHACIDMHTYQTHCVDKHLSLCSDKQTCVPVSECLLKFTGTLLNVKEAANRTGRTTTGATTAGKEEIRAQANVGSDWALPIPGSMPKKCHQGLKKVVPSLVVL